MLELERTLQLYRKILRGSTKMKAHPDNLCVLVTFPSTAARRTHPVCFLAAARVSFQAFSDCESEQRRRNTNTRIVFGVAGLWGWGREMAAGIRASRSRSGRFKCYSRSMVNM